jgi:hypothetical protein
VKMLFNPCILFSLYRKYKNVFSLFIMEFSLLINFIDFDTYGEIAFH